MSIHPKNFISISNSLLSQAYKDGMEKIVVKILVRKGNSVLMLKRSPNEDVPDLYELPGGGINKTEDIFSAGRRELCEETGLSIKEFYSEPSIIDAITVSDNKKCRVYVFDVLTKEDEIVINLSEHNEYKWVSVDEINGLFIFPEVKEFLRKVFVPLSPTENWEKKIK